MKGVKLKLRKPMLIIFDGLDCCGKSTQLYKLANFLKLNGNKLTIMTSPTLSLRNYLDRIETDELLDRFELTLDSSVKKMALCFKSFSLAYEYNKLIKELLHNNSTVLLDRWLYSTFIYNCISSELKTMCDTVYKDTLKDSIDINFFLDTDLETCIERSKVDKKDNISFLATGENLKNVYNRHLETLGKKYVIRDNLCIVNGDNTEERVFEEIIFELNKVNERY